jgi:hypothetical protein
LKEKQGSCNNPKEPVRKTAHTSPKPATSTSGWGQYVPPENTSWEEPPKPAGSWALQQFAQKREAPPPSSQPQAGTWGNAPVTSTSNWYLPHIAVSACFPPSLILGSYTPPLHAHPIGGKQHLKTPLQTKMAGAVLQHLAVADLHGKSGTAASKSYRLIKINCLLYQSWPHLATCYD